MGCFWPKNGSKFLRISSEEKGISSEVIAISSEGMRISSEEMGFSSEFIPQIKEKKYISIYISLYVDVVVERTRVCVCIVCAHTRVGVYAQAHRHDRQKENLQRKFLAGRKKINRCLPPVRLSLCRTKNHSYEKIS